MGTVPVREVDFDGKNTNFEKLSRRRRGQVPSGFLETIAAQDAWVHYKDRFFFVNGCCCDWDRNTRKVLWAHLEMYELESDHGNAIADVCSITKPTVREVMEEFVNIPLIDGKTFWELENELEWV